MVAKLLPEARRFILIDHSIAGFGGHHYEYAAHVLNSASQRGYKPILVTNRSFRPLASVPYETHAVYKYGLWFSLSKPMWYRVAERRLWRVRRWHTTMALRLTFSPAGQRTALLRFWARSLLGRSEQVAGSEGRHSRLPLAARSLLHVLRRSLRIADNALAVAAREYGRCRKLILGRGFSVLRRAYDARRYYAFKGVTRRLMHSLRPDDGDIVFCPTVLEVEACAIAAVLRETPYSKKAPWHLLCRRNLLSGRRADYAAQESTLAAFRRAFAPVRQAAATGAVHFYTDTPELSEQHSLLGVAGFSTLPIPHTFRPRHTSRLPGAPLRLTYLGDARKEKGYHHLPTAIGNLWTAHVQTEKVRFVIQSNYNTPAGEVEAVIARGQLEAFDSDGVELVYGPLPSEEYADLLLSSDAVLIPYDQDRYYARSSGILVEALSAGIPVVVPAGTWMARQFADEVYLYRRALHQRSRPSMEWKAHGGPTLAAGARPAPAAWGKSMRVIASGNVQSTWWLEVPPQAAIVSIRILPESMNDLDSLLVVVDELLPDGFGPRKEALLDPGRATHELYAAVALNAGARRVRVGLANPYGGTAVLLDEVDVGFVVAEESDVSCQPALGAVGVVYSQPDKLTDAIRELVDHYDHYRVSALAIAAAVSREHNGDALVDALIRTGNTRQRESADVRRDGEP